MVVSIASPTLSPSVFCEGGMISGLRHNSQREAQPGARSIVNSAGIDTSPGVSNKYQRQPAEYQIIIK